MAKARKYYSVHLQNRQTGHKTVVRGFAKSPTSLTHKHGYSGKKYQITEFHIAKYAK